MIRIAIVEDEDSYADELAGYLQHFQKESGVRLHITRYRDGDEIAENYPGGFDILLMDIQMRFMDGMTAAEKIRALDRDVIALSHDDLDAMAAVLLIRGGKMVGGET